MYAKARSTLKIQMKKLLLKKQFYIIDKQYKLAENETNVLRAVMQLIIWVGQNIKYPAVRRDRIMPPNETLVRAPIWWVSSASAECVICT